MNKTHDYRTAKTMNHQFDELTKSLAQSVTRRAALKKFGVGLAGMALACFGVANAAPPKKCSTDADCRSGFVCCYGSCVDDGKSFCSPGDSCCCYKSKKFCGTKLPPCTPGADTCFTICDIRLGCF